MMHRFTSMLALATTLAVAGPVSAQVDDKEAAQQKLDEAKRLMAEGQYQEACTRLEESRRLVAGMATQFRLAECYEKLGRLASAWSNFVEVADAARLAAMTERERVARERAAALKPRLSYLAIQVPEGVAATPGLVIESDGIVVERARWGVATPMDPGPHRVVATAPGKSPFHSQVDVEGEGTKVVVSLTVLADAQVPSTPGVPILSLEPRKGGPSPILLGAGYGATALGVIGGAIFAVLSNTKAADAEDQTDALKLLHGEQPCRVSRPECDSILDQREDQGLFLNAAGWSFIGAGALGIATTIYAVTAYASSTAAGRVRVAPVIAHRASGIVIATDW